MLDTNRRCVEHSGDGVYWITLADGEIKALRTVDAGVRMRPPELPKAALAHPLGFSVSRQGWEPAIQTLVAGRQ